MNDQNEQKGNLIIGEGVTVTGTFVIPSKAVINGSLNGELTADEIMVGKAGKLTGKITARNADIHGETHDTLSIANHLILRSTGKIHGRATYGELEIERGGLVSGTVLPEDASQAASNVPAQRSGTPAPAAPQGAGSSSGAQQQGSKPNDNTPSGA
jgi:cytoskeletal protein CcmA (bactofilin family)